MSKYHKAIKGVSVDVYDILVAYGITCPAQQHALKKLLMPGQRGAKTFTEDMREVILSVERSIELHAEPSADAENEDGWIKWSGGDYPFDDSPYVRILRRNGDSSGGRAQSFMWAHENGLFDIVAYRTFPTIKFKSEDGWIEWPGTGTPNIDRSTQIEVTLRDGTLCADKVVNFNWSHYGEYGDVIAYRVVETKDEAKPDADGWFQWSPKDGNPDFPEGTKISGKLSTGEMITDVAENFYWGRGTHVVAYKFETSKQTDDGWIAWKAGDDLPIINPETKVQVKVPSGKLSGQFGGFDWSSSSFITAYKVLPE